MTIKTKIACIAVAAAMAFSATAANATTYIIPVVVNGTTNFGPITPGGGTFFDTFLFSFPSNGRITVTISSTQTSNDPNNTNVNFVNSRTRFNGVPLTVLSSGFMELRTLVGAGVNGPAQSRLEVRGSAGSLGNYSGSLTYTIPEPAIWAMMILGMGVVGASMRVRRRKIAFAM